MIIATTLEPPPDSLAVTHWSSRLLAGHLGIGDATVARAWRRYGVEPWRRETLKFSTDPELEAKVNRTGNVGVGSGADWLEEFKPYIEDRNTVVASPHKVWSPQSNDLILQLRKRAISKVILGGMLANICVESHLRDLLENGFEVMVVRDATAGPRHLTRGDGYQAALINYAFLAHAVMSTDDVIADMSTHSPSTT